MSEPMEIEAPFGAGLPEAGLEEPVSEEDIEETSEDLDDDEEGFEEEEDFGDEEESEEPEEEGSDDEQSEDGDDDEEEESEEEESDVATEDVRKEISALTEEGDACAAMLAAKNLNYLDFKAEIEENGQLSKASMKALNDAGFSDKLISGYIEGQQARYQASYVGHIFKQAGGKEAYEKLMQWAGRNLNEKEAARYDKAVDSNDIDTALTALENLMNRREKAQGVKPKLVEGRTPRTVNAVRGYASLEDMANAMDDPRYETNSDYTRKVDRRIAASNF